MFLVILYFIRTVGVKRKNKKKKKQTNTWWPGKVFPYSPGTKIQSYIPSGFRLHRNCYET